MEENEQGSVETVEVGSFRVLSHVASVDPKVPKISPRVGGAA